MNNCVLIGRLTKDPDLKYTPGSNTAVSNLTIAVDNYNNSTKTKSADFIPVVVWGKQAENAAQYLKKGREVAINGRISVRNYDGKNGEKRYITEIIANPVNGVQYLGSGKSQQAVGGEDMFPESDEFPY